ncbi:hypothetical protein TWF281_001427 [Arthrobotrys megalospora]
MASAIPSTNELPTDFPSSALEQVTNIDNDGDIIAVVTLKDSVPPKRLGAFRASSKVLSLASPVLKDMLSHIEGELEWNSKDGAALNQLDLISRDEHTLENETTAEIVLNILHHKHAYNPESVPLQTLYNISSFCYDYQLEAAVFPTVANWINMIWARSVRNACMTTPAAEPIIRTEDGSTGKPKDHPLGKVKGHPHDNSACHKWLWIAKVFRLDKIVRKCGQNAVFCSSRKTTSGLATLATEKTNQPSEALPRSQCMFDDAQLLLLSPKDVEAIWQQRDILIKRLMDILELKCTMFQKAVLADTTICNRENARVAKTCDTCQMGGLFQLKAKLGPSPKDLDVYTLTEICTLFKTLESCESSISFLAAPSARNPNHHLDCDISRYFAQVASEVEKVDVRDILVAQFLKPIERAKD